MFLKCVCLHKSLSQIHAVIVDIRSFLHKVNDAYKLKDNKNILITNVNLEIEIIEYV